MGWHISSVDGSEVIWHNGGTGGFRSYLGYDREWRVGVVVLSNASTVGGVGDIALHLLCPGRPLAEPPKERSEISIDLELFDRYVGRYKLTPTFVITVTREGTQFFVQAIGQPKLEVFAESEREYFLKSVNAQITFDVDSDGRGIALTLHQNGQHQYGARID